MIELLIWRYGTWTVCSSHSAKAHSFASDEEQDVSEQIALLRLKTVQALVRFISTPEWRMCMGCSEICSQR